MRQRMCSATRLLPSSSSSSSALSAPPPFFFFSSSSSSSSTFSSSSFLLSRDVLELVVDNLARGVVVARRQDLLGQERCLGKDRGHTAVVVGRHQQQVAVRALHDAAHLVTQHGQARLLQLNFEMNRGEREREREEEIRRV